MGSFLEKLFAPLQTTKNAPDSPLFWRIIPDDMGIPSSASLAYRGGAMDYVDAYSAAHEICLAAPSRWYAINVSSS
jgi:hypothetical protein